jgi:cytochrome c oxidase subunit 4
LPLLLILMGVKFFSVVLYFMHLKFDNRLFSLMFYIGIVLAVGCYCVALASMHFFSA